MDKIVIFGRDTKWSGKFEVVYLARCQEYKEFIAAYKKFGIKLSREEQKLLAQVALPILTMTTVMIHHLRNLYKRKESKAKKLNSKSKIWKISQLIK